MNMVTEKSGDRRCHLCTCLAYQDLLLVNYIALIVVTYLCVACFKPTEGIQIIAYIVAILSMCVFVHARFVVAPAMDGFRFEIVLLQPWMGGVYAWAHRAYQKIEPARLVKIVQATLRVVVGFAAVMLLGRSVILSHLGMVYYVVLWVGSLVLCCWFYFIELLLVVAYEEFRDDDCLW